MTFDCMLYKNQYAKLNLEVFSSEQKFCALFSEAMERIHENRHRMMENFCRSSWLHKYFYFSPEFVNINSILFSFHNKRVYRSYCLIGFWLFSLLLSISFYYFISRIIFCLFRCQMAYILHKQKDTILRRRDIRAWKQTAIYSRYSHHNAQDMIQGVLLPFVWSRRLCHMDCSNFIITFYMATMEEQCDIFECECWCVMPMVVCKRTPLF